MKKYIIFITVLILWISCLSKKKEEQQLTQKILEKGIYIKEINNIIIDTLPPKKISRTLEEYKKNVRNFEKKLDSVTILTTQDLESVVPVTEKEFSFYYGLTYSDKKDETLFYKIDILIFNYAKKDKGDVLFLCLGVAEFVDGEYADSYYGTLDSVVLDNKKKFCAIYKYLSKESRRRLENFYNEVCLRRL